ncbi:3-methyl-2-oxobutanoate hydroxymethyltransferase [Chitinispirillales bacterium ANBcel5]|uniref:3-methyl-2-oxobutanoate hydroxymethyltransferase n=1 Tax=Cellulosispirillum alkaliphilum TaxID=3039283 RepID=UPI002A51B0E1|nr:3-methyl-2-oxobutanoate hydroxymethyltransferase [Chitinispirillales bacterium ANBcel5]
MSKKTADYLKEKKINRVPITMVTAYDYPTAQLAEQAHIDSILVGDSLGTNVLGYQSEREVTIHDIAHHLKAVKRAINSAFLIADLPFGSTGTVSSALSNAKRLLECGADCIKIEGWAEKVNIVKELSQAGIKVCAHIGYNPQIHDGIPRTFGKSATQAYELLQSALELQRAGSVLIVLEKIPLEVAEIISNSISIPTIGIGSGNRCDGQVLVINDLLGMTPKVFKHVKPYANIKDDIFQSFQNYSKEVESRTFPTDSHCLHLNEDELKNLRKLIS